MKIHSSTFTCHLRCEHLPNYTSSTVSSLPVRICIGPYWRKLCTNGSRKWRAVARRARLNRPIVNIHQIEKCKIGRCELWVKAYHFLPFFFPFPFCLPFFLFLTSVDDSMLSSASKDAAACSARASALESSSAKDA